MNSLTKWCVLPCAVFLLFACGGSSLDSDTDQPSPSILLSAGPNQTVDEGVTVNLTGEGSADSALTFSWSASPTLTITHDDTSTGSASFVAPTTTETLIYTLTLQATDADGNIASDSMQVEVRAVNELPTVDIAVSLLDGSSLSTYPAGVDILLDGSASSDPDDTDDGIASYRWQQTSGEAVTDGVNLNDSSIQVTTPVLTEANTLVFELLVTDQEGGQTTDSVTVSVLSDAQTLPSVDAGVDHEVFSGESIILQGAASSTVPAALPLTYLWQTDSSLPAQIDDTTAGQTFAVAPAVSSTQVANFTLQVTDQFGNQVEDTIAVTIKPWPLYPINDTGVVLQASETQVDTQHKGAYPGQDGQRGADIISANGLLEKAGRGAQGFDFTRLDEIGDEVDDTSQAWRCVRDNVTGLIWEVKSTDAALHDSTHSYSWYFDTNNGGFEGHLTGASTSCSIAQCNTTDFITQVNTDGLCGFFDWRLPTHNELMSIVHLGRTASPLVDLDYFPDTATGLSAPIWYWTRLPNVDGVDADSGTAQSAWAIDFATGNDNFLNKSTAASIRLVRAGR